MKKVLLLCSHLNSGVDNLFSVLNQHPRIQGIQNKLPYISPLNLEIVTSHKHKFENSASIYMDVLNFNFEFLNRQLYNLCKFIYVIGEPKDTLNSLVAQNLYKPLQATRYYCFRLRRICEMARKTPGAVFLTKNNLINGVGHELIQEYLKLKTPIESIQLEKSTTPDLISSDLLQEANDSYEYYLYYLKNQDLKYI